MSFFLSFILGVVLFYSVRYFPFSTVFIFLLSSAFFLLKKKYFLIVIVISGAVFAFLRYEPVTDIPYTRDKIAVEGVFESYPVKTQSGSFKQDFTVTSATNMDTGEQISILSGKEIVMFSDRAFEPGTECKLYIALLKTRKRLNPGELVREDICANLKVIYYARAERISPYSKVQQYRYRINRYVEENLEKDPGAFVTSITTGEAANMSEELKDAFKVTGLAHILSISGSHFGLFSVLLFGIFRSVVKALPYRFLQRITIYLTPSQVAAVCCFPFMLAYLALSGASIPAIRSFIMISLFLLGLLIGKKGYWLNSLLFAAFIIVLWQPESIFSISFQLSFLAVLFIGLAVQNSIDDKKEGRKVVRYFKNVLLMTLSASIGTAPLAAYYFHYFPVISPVSNLVIGPFIGFLLIPVSVLSCFLFLMTGHFVFTPIVSLASEMSIESVKFLSKVPYASVNVPAFPPILLFLFYAGSGIYFLSAKQLPGKKKAQHYYSVPPEADIDTSENFPLKEKNESPKRESKFKKRFVLIIPFAPLAIYFSLLIFEKRELSVTFLDVGQGDSSVIELPDGKTMAIDTGRTGRETVSFLKYRGRKTLDVLAVSHVHPDHAGGLNTVLNKLRVMEIWDNGRISYANDLESHSLKRGDVFEGKGYRICVLHPYPEFYSMHRGEYVSANNDSLVLRINGKSLSFLFAGDIEEEAEENILHLGQWTKSDVIKIPHHGGRTSAYGPFFSVVSPDIAIISAGRDNSFGHPHQETLDALEGIHIFRTDVDGAVKIRETDEGVQVKTFREAQLKEAKSLSDEIKNVKLLTETW